MKNLKPLLLILFLSCFIFASFKKKDKPIKLLPKEFREMFSYVPEQILEIDLINARSFFKCLRDTSQEKLIQPFYCFKKEVSNALYDEFLDDIKMKGDSKTMKITQIDSLKWNLHFNEELVKLYHWHPAFDNYPVVNITREGALVYCSWLEAKLNSQSVNKLTYSVGLPTHFEWITAAQGGLGFSPYPWGGPYFRNTKGELLANFLHMGDESIHFNSETKSYEIISGVSGSISDAYTTAPVDAYFPNDYDLYNMSGNVAEMISEPGIACGGGWRSTGFDIRCQSTMEYTDPQPDIGFRPIVKIVE